LIDTSLVALIASYWMPSHAHGQYYMGQNYVVIQ
jgi:FtsP/CotA-like multicopper oxidase with cupredoxin domain